VGGEVLAGEICLELFDVFVVGVPGEEYHVQPFLEVLIALITI